MTELVGPPGVLDEDTYVFPCSRAQERLWFLQQVDFAAAYSMPMAVQLSGSLDLDALAGSFADLVRRHESLRTSFASDAGKPVQVVHPSVTVRPGFHDLGTLPGARRDAELSRLIHEEIARPFDVSRPPLLRISVFRRSRNDHVLVIVVHHIVCDAWSTAVILREIAGAYTQLVAGRPAGLGEPAVQYADYSLWERDWLAGEAAASQLDRWRRRLRPPLPTLDLPTDLPRPARSSYRGARHQLHIPAAAVSQLRALGDEVGATLFMTLLAAFGVLLHRYTDQPEIVIGTPIAGRHRMELENLIGFFVNTLPIRLDLSGEPTFRDVLCRARDVAFEAYDNQDLPFDVLVEKLRPPRDLSRHPIFQVMLSLQNVPLRWSAMAGLAVAPFPMPSDSAKFDVLLEVTEKDTGLSAEFEYSSDLFTASTIQIMGRYLEKLIRVAAITPDVPVGRLPLTARPAGSSAKPAPQAPPSSLVDAVDGRARSAPSDVAVSWPGGALSYQALAERSRELARRLEGCHGQVVAVQLPPGADRAASVLAVFRAGAAVLLLDPALPERYRQRVVAASAATAIVTSDGPRRIVGAGKAAGSPAGLRATSAAELAVLAARLQKRFGLVPGETVLSAVPPGHPDAIWALCWPLACGGRVIVPAPDADVPETIGREPVSVLHCSPRELRRVVDGQQGGESPQRPPRLILCGAGPVPTALADAASQVLDCPVYGVHYVPGPAGELIVERCRSGWPSRYLPLGQASDGTLLAILDRYGQPVPDGAFGRLHLLSPSAGGRPESLDMTARQRHDGRFELADPAQARLGWIDGMRVDVADAETVLLAERGVTDALLAITQDEDGLPQLCAWIRPAAARPPTPAGLAASIRRELPENFVPRHMFLVDEMPAGKDGTLDPARAHTAPAAQPVLDVAVASWMRPAELNGPLRHCLTEFGLPPRLRLVSAGQVIRQLRDPDGIFVTSGAGVNVLAIRIEDLAPLAAQFDDLAFATALDAGLADFLAAVRDAAERSVVPWVVLVCPPTPGVLDSPARLLAAEVTERRLLAGLSGRQRVTVLPAGGDGGAVLPARIARTILNLSGHHVRAMIVDAEEVLRGLARPGQADTGLQGFLLAQHRLGVRLCVAGTACTRDLLAVFREHRGTPLALRHLTTWQLDWDLGRALGTIVAELGLPPDQVAFVTTSAVRSALAAAALPDMLTLRLPADAARAVAMLRLLPSLPECAGADEPGMAGAPP